MLELHDEALIRTNDGPFIFDLFQNLSARGEYFIKAKPASFHNIANNNRSTSADAHLTMHKHIPFNYVVIDEFKAFLEVRRDILQRTIVNLNMQMIPIRILNIYLIPNPYLFPPR